MRRAPAAARPVLAPGERARAATKSRTAAPPSDTADAVLPLPN